MWRAMRRAGFGFIAGVGERLLELAEPGFELAVDPGSKRRPRRPLREHGQKDSWIYRRPRSCRSPAAWRRYAPWQALPSAGWRSSMWRNTERCRSLTAWRTSTPTILGLAARKVVIKAGFAQSCSACKLVSASRLREAARAEHFGDRRDQVFAIDRRARHRAFDVTQTIVRQFC